MFVNKYNVFLYLYFGYNIDVIADWTVLMVYIRQTCTVAS